MPITDIAFDQLLPSVLHIRLFKEFAGTAAPPAVHIFSIGDQATVLPLKNVPGTVLELNQLLPLNEYRTALLVLLVAPEPAFKPV